MKRLFCIFALAVAFCATVQAQDFKAGLSFGVVPSQVDGDGMSGYNKIGLTGGAYVKWERSDRLVLQADIAYTMKGSRQASSKNVDFSRPELTTNYIDVALTCGYRFMDNLIGRAGLVPSVLIYDKEAFTGGSEIIGAMGFKRFNLLATAGISYFLSDHFSVNAAYNYSVLSIRKGNLEVVDYDVKVQNAQYHNYITLTLS